MGDGTEEEKAVPSCSSGNSSSHSIFLSKYFSGKSDLTQMHWKKIISGMNQSKSSPQANCSSISSILDDESDQTAPGSSSSTNTDLLSLKNYQDDDDYRSVNRLLNRDKNTGLGGAAPANCLAGKGFQNKEQPINGTVHCARNNRFALAHCLPMESVGKSFNSNSLKSESGPAAVKSTVSDSCTQKDGLSSPCLPQPCPDIARYPPFSSPLHANGSEVQKNRSKVPDSSVTEDALTGMVDRLVETPHSTKGLDKTSLVDSTLCQVCEDIAAGFYCGAFVCEACKKFFIRASKQEKQKFVCLRESMCKITKESRVQCQYCRYQKCLQLNMYYPGEGKRSVKSIHVSGIPCRVCGSPSSGFHFGALTCEGCKGFFRRMVKEREPGMYKCSTGGNCEISMHTRNMCKACRYQKCISNGMSVEGSRIGRQPNAVKHAISLEVKKQHLDQPEQKKFPSTPAQESRRMGKEETLDGASAETVDSRSFLSPSVHASLVGMPAGPVDVKDEPDEAVNLSDVVLTEVSPATIVKQEPIREEVVDTLTSSFETAGKELSYMCAVSRAKTATLNRSEFVSYPAMWKKQMKHFDFHAQCCIRFSKKVPGFKELPLDDKVALVQNSTYPIVVLNHARHYELDTGFYNFFNFSKPEEEVILKMCPGYTTLQSHFRHMGVMAQTMQMTDMEFTLLSSILLCDTDCPGLQSPNLVDQLQNRIMNYFQNYEIKMQTSGLVRFGELLLRISELKLASLHHIQTISSLLAQHQDLELPQLFKEMFF